MGRTEKYQYTPLGLLVSKTDRNNQVTTYTYDFLDRQIKTSISVPCKKGTLTNELETTYYTNGKKKKSLSRQKETGVPTVELSSEFTYNSKGQLVRCYRDATLITYLYRPNGLRYTILYKPSSKEFKPPPITVDGLGCSPNGEQTQLVASPNAPVL